MGDIAPILLGVVVLAALVTIVMGYKSWPIYTIILMVFNLAAIGGFVYLSARTLKTYDVWRTEVAGWEKTVKEKSAVVDGLINGRGDKVVAVTEDGRPVINQFDTIALAELQTMLRNMLLHRGRAWGLIDADTRGTLPNNQAPLSANIGAMGNTVTADITWRLPEAPKAMGLEPGMSVYLFADTINDERAVADGTHYFGFYLINSVEPKSLKLTRVETLMPGENVQLNNRPVLVYQLFPNDDWRDVRGSTLAEIKQSLPGVPDATIQEFFKNGKPITAAEEQALLEQDAIDAETKTAVSTLNKSYVWHRVKVKATLPISEISGKVMPAVAPAPMPGEGENPTEETVAAPASFNAGTKILLDQDSAKQLVDAGKVEYDGNDYRIYKRPLRDYPSEYKRSRENFFALGMAINEIDRLEGLNAITKQSTEATIKQHQARTALINEDLANLKKETTALTAYDTQLRQQIATVEKERLALLDNINKTAAAITQFQMEVLQKVNSQLATQDQAAATP